MTEGEPRVYDYVPLDELLEYLARHGLAMVPRSLKWGPLRGPVVRAEHASERKAGPETTGQ